VSDNGEGRVLFLSGKNGGGAPERQEFSSLEQSTDRGGKGGGVSSGKTEGRVSLGGHIVWGKG